MPIENQGTAQSIKPETKQNNPTLQEYRRGIVNVNERTSFMTIESPNANGTGQPASQTPDIAWSGAKQAPPAPKIETATIEQYVHQLQSQQNLAAGFVGGLIAAVICAIIWAAITVATDMQIGWMAIGVGFLVGFSVRALGKGFEKRFGYVGAGLSLFGCLLGNFFAIVALISREASTSIPEILLVFVNNPGLIPQMMQETFQPMDLLFYGLALYEGYRLSFRQITQADITGLKQA